MYIIKNVCIFDGEKIIKDKHVVLSHGKIVNITDSLNECELYLKNSQNKSSILNENYTEFDGGGNILAPGFIDIQVNGGGGAFFNSKPILLKTLQTIRDAHLQYGTTSILPTFISDSNINTRYALQTVKEAVKQSMSGILGIHLEGPFLNPQKNGIHQKKYIRSPTKQEIDEICHFELPIKMITLAPEMIPEIFLEQLKNENVIIFAGHTNATFRQMEKAFSLGITGITHFFNACSSFLSREPGVVGAGLFFENIWCGLIADGFHVDYTSIKIAFKNKSIKKFILVSDAMPPVGTNLTEFDIQNQKIYVKDNIYKDEKGTLAGSSLTMHQALKNIVIHNCASLPEALAMSSTNPADCLGLGHKKGKVLCGFDADLILLNKDNLDLIKIIQNGNVII